jgi:hypothetical protein
LSTPVPWEKAVPRVLGRGISNRIERLDYALTRMRPNLFAYQHIFELKAL